MLEAEQERKARVHIMQSLGDGTAFVLAAMPRGRWSDEVRQDIEQCLVESTGASYCDHGVFVGRYDTMLIHFYLTGCQALSETESADLTESCWTSLRAGVSVFISRSPRPAAPRRPRVWPSSMRTHSRTCTAARRARRRPLRTSRCSRLSASQVACWSMLSKTTATKFASACTSCTTSC